MYLPLGDAAKGISMHLSQLSRIRYRKSTLQLVEKIVHDGSILALYKISALLKGIGAGGAW